MLAYYAEFGRSFPWRETKDPWTILVSEVMLQQTQTDRVLPKFIAWRERFPDAASLAASPLPEVLRLWSGLGYNRRALALAAAARIVVDSGFPGDEKALLALPGVGPYTARAVLAFAFGLPTVFIETNIRSVFLQHFFPSEESVGDARIALLVEATLDRKDPRTWYYALMDYGVSIKKMAGNPNRRSAHYARQTPFADSKRRVRGGVLRELASLRGAVPREELARRLCFSRERVEEALADLHAEGFLRFDADLVGLAEEAPRYGALPPDGPMRLGRRKKHRRDG
ncbi:MAG: A/G-specific adenine glycosylase [Rectinemataceae bacterium]